MIWPVEIILPSLSIVQLYLLSVSLETLKFCNLRKVTSLVIACRICFSSLEDSFIP